MLGAQSLGVFLSNRSSDQTWLAGKSVKKSSNILLNPTQFPLSPHKIPIISQLCPASLEDTGAPPEPALHRASARLVLSAWHDLVGAVGSMLGGWGNLGFHSHGGTLAEWFLKSHPINYKWMRTGGTPMTESSILGKLLVDCEFIFGNWINRIKRFKMGWKSEAQGPKIVRFDEDGAFRDDALHEWLGNGHLWLIYQLKMVFVHGAKSTEVQFCCGRSRAAVRETFQPSWNAKGDIVSPELGIRSGDIYWGLTQPQFLRQELIAPSSGLLLSRLWGRHGADVLPCMLEPPGTLLNMAKRIELFKVTTPRPPQLCFLVYFDASDQFGISIYYTTHSYWSDKPT